MEKVDAIEGTVAKWLRSWIPNPWVPCSKPVVAPRLTQPSVLSRSIKQVPAISGNLVVKSKLPPRSGSSLDLRTWDLGSRTPRPETRDPETLRPGTLERWDLNPGTLELGPWACDPGTWDPDTWNPGTSNWPPTTDCINFICEANFDNKKLLYVCRKRRGSNKKIKFWNIFFSFLCQK